MVPPALQRRLRHVQQQQGAVISQQGGTWQEALHPRGTGGKFAPAHTAQSATRDRQVAAARRHGDAAGAARAQHKYEQRWTKFLSSLPMAKKGRNLKEVAHLVRTARTKTDDQLKAAAKKLRTSDPDAAATIDALLKNRDRIRKQQAKDHPAPHRRARGATAPAASATPSVPRVQNAPPAPAGSRRRRRRLRTPPGFGPGIGSHGTRRT